MAAPLLLDRRRRGPACTHLLACSRSTGPHAPPQPQDRARPARGQQALHHWAAGAHGRGHRDLVVARRRRASHRLRRPHRAGVRPAGPHGKDHPAAQEGAAVRRAGRGVRRRLEPRGGAGALRCCARSSVCLLRRRAEREEPDLCLSCLLNPEPPPIPALLQTKGIGNSAGLTMLDFGPKEPAEVWAAEGIHAKLPGLCLASSSSSKGGYGVLASCSTKTDLRVYSTAGRWAAAAAAAVVKCCCWRVLAAPVPPLAFSPASARPQPRPRSSLPSLLLHSGSWARWTRGG